MRKGSLLSVFLSVALATSLFALPWHAYAKASVAENDPFVCTIAYGDDFDLGTWVALNCPGWSLGGNSGTDSLKYSTSDHLAAGTYALVLSNAASETAALNLVVDPLKAAFDRPPASKSYDGTTNVGASGTVSNAVSGDVKGIMVKDDVSVFFAYDSDQVIEARKITASLSGADSANYSIIGNETFPGTITPKYVDARWDDQAPYTYTKSDQGTTINAAYTDVMGRSIDAPITFDGESATFRQAGEYTATAASADPNYIIAPTTSTKSYTMNAGAFDDGDGVLAVSSTADDPASLPAELVRKTLDAVGSDEGLVLRTDEPLLNTSFTPEAFDVLANSGKSLAVTVGNETARIEFPSALLQQGAFDASSSVQIVLEQVPSSAKAGLPDFSLPDGSSYRVTDSDVAIRASVSVDGRSALAPGTIQSGDEAISVSLLSDGGYTEGADYLVLSYDDDGTPQDTTVAQCAASRGGEQSAIEKSSLQFEALHCTTFVVSHQTVGQAATPLTLAATGDSDAWLLWTTLLLASGVAALISALASKRRVRRAR